jgi:hypothetical protein
MPWADWQFYAVTTAALAGGWLVVKPLLVRRGKPAQGCSNCTFGGAHRAAPQTGSGAILHQIGGARPSQGQVLASRSGR